MPENGLLRDFENGVLRRIYESGRKKVIEKRRNYVKIIVLTF
jgi:hypothetical protein